MAELKTTKNDASVETFLEGIADVQQREDAFRVLRLMEESTGESPSMWGSSIIGFGSYHYKYASGRENDWFQVGFAPRKSNLTFYIMGFPEYDSLLQKLGKHKMSGSCLHIKRLDDVDTTVLREMISESVAKMRME